MMAEPRGYFGIGIYGSKTKLNVGTLWRSAAIFDAAYVFTIGKRWPQQASDTLKAWKHVPFLEFQTSDEWIEALPKGCVPVAIEIAAGARPLQEYTHPERACYLLGAEDGGVPKHLLARCRDVVQLPGTYCLNVAVAGSIVMYDRAIKRGGDSSAG